MTSERFNTAAVALKKGTLLDTIQLAHNMPPQAGAVFWARTLRSRSTEPVMMLQRLLPEMMALEEGRELVKMHETFDHAVAKFEAQIRDQWLASLDARIQDRLRQPLLVKDPDTELLSMNFDQDLVRLLREVKYFHQIGVEVPEIAKVIFSRAETFRQHTGNAEMVANICNEMRQELLPVEVGLMHSKFVHLDEALEEGLKHLNWKSHSIPAFLKKTMALAKEAFAVMRVIKTNSKQAVDIVSSWSLASLFNRGFSRTLAVSEFSEQHQQALDSRMLEVREEAERVHQLVAEILDAVQLSRGDPAWKEFVDHMNDQLMGALLESVLSSIRAIRDLLDPNIISSRNYAPALEVRLELIAPDVLFHPELRESARGIGVSCSIFSLLLSERPHFMPCRTDLVLLRTFFFFLFLSRAFGFITQWHVGTGAGNGAKLGPGLCAGGESPPYYRGRGRHQF